MDGANRCRSLTASERKDSLTLDMWDGNDDDVDAKRSVRIFYFSILFIFIFFYI